MLLSSRKKCASHLTGQCRCRPSTPFAAPNFSRSACYSCAARASGARDRCQNRDAAFLDPHVAVEKWVGAGVTVLTAMRRAQLLEFHAASRLARS